MTNTERRMVNQLLTELESLDGEDVVAVAATNLLEEIDDAVLRSGRFDERIEVPPPDAPTRRALLRDAVPEELAPAGVDWGPVVEATAGYACDDLLLVAETGARRALRDDDPLTADHLLAAVRNHRSAVADWPARDRYSDSEYGSDLRYIS